MSENTVLDAALGYSRLLNWAVIPLHTIIDGHCTCKKNCDSPGKHPRTINGVKDATTNSMIIEKWFTDYPNSNIGIATGEASGFFVVDVDLKNHGYESLNNLIDKYGLIPDTVEAITGGDGRHYLFQQHRGVKNRTNLLPGIDIRGDGGYIVVSPSVHISGNSYEWELSSKPYVNKIADAPNWLLEMIIQFNEKLSGTKTSSYWLELLSGVKEGERNDKAASFAGYLLRRYIDPYLVVEIMKMWNESRVVPPLDNSELISVIESIARKERLRRRSDLNVGY